MKPGTREQRRSASHRIIEGTAATTSRTPAADRVRASTIDGEDDRCIA
jgi:hypothetical protein